MMKLLYLITRAEHGGAQAHLFELIDGFRGAFEVHLATGEEGFLTAEARRLGATIHIVPNLVQPISLLKDVRAFREIHSLIRQLRPTLVHAHSSKAGFLGRLAARAVGGPAIFTVHGWGFAEGVSWKRKLLASFGERMVARFSSGIITVSEADRDLALRYRIAQQRNMTVIHNGVRDTSEQSHPDAGDAAHIVMVARFSPQKDQALLLKALVGQEKPFRLSLVGEGPDQPAVHALAKKLDLNGRVNFLGASGDVSRILAGANVFVLTSNWEGLPISILEAMRAGLPVIASDVGGVREAVVDGETGFLVDRGNLVMLHSRLQLLLNDPELRKKMGEAGRMRYLEHFTVERMLEATLRVYKDVLKEHPSMGAQHRSH